MRTVSAIDVRKHFGELLDAASAGERILIERDRRPMAALVSVEDLDRLGVDREEALSRRLAALDRLATWGARAGLEPAGLDEGSAAVAGVRQDRADRAERIDRSLRPQARDR